ncbi:MAG: efflux RND transporter periplasmic adaptor subunit [bacterium]|nr:efflux RND transporter periplasmic adaptor subunit [bacterium]
MIITQHTVNMKNTLLILLAAVLLTGCGSADPKAKLEKLRKNKADIETQIAAIQTEIAKTDTTGGKKLVDVIVEPLVSSTFKTYIEVQGRVDADESVSLSSEMPGTVTKIFVKVGDNVAKGQVLAETDARATQQQLAALQTSMTLVNQIYDKQKSLWDQKIGTEIQYLQAKTMKEGLELSINGLQEQLKMTKVISPIEGTVDLMNIKIGQAIAPGLSAITVVNFSNLKVKADVAESYAARVKNGNEVLVLFPDMNDTVLSTVHYASRAINNLTRTFAVEVKLDGKKEYHPNQVAKLKINDYQSPKPVIAVPVKFIQKTTNGSYVIVVKNGKAIKQPVLIGHEYSGFAEIREGLSAGDLMITQGYELVNANEEVNVKK